MERRLGPDCGFVVRSDYNGADLDAVQPQSSPKPLMRIAPGAQFGVGIFARIDVGEGGGFGIGRDGQFQGKVTGLIPVGSMIDGGVTACGRCPANRRKRPFPARWEADSERVGGELQREVPRCLPERTLVHRYHRCSGQHRSLAGSLQHGPAAQLARISQSRAVSDGGRNELWESRSLCDLGKLFEFSPFPQPHRQR